MEKTENHNQNTRKQDDKLKVADAVLKALKSNKGLEIIVNSGSIRPLLAIAQLFPNFGDKVTEWVGVNKLNRSRV